MKLTIAETVQLALACPQTAIVMRGPPGSGKTFGTSYELRKAGHTVIRLDCLNMPPELLAALPIVDQANKTVAFMAHAMWTPRPKLAFIVDELFKAPKHIVDTFLPLVYGSEFMGHVYGPDTIRIITCNNADFGLGDREQPHMGNRTCDVEIADPSIAEATKIMVEHSYDSRILRWAEGNQAALVSWDGSVVKSLKQTERGDYYGFEPEFPKRKFVSMRSLDLASNYLKSGVDGNALQAALEGCLGVKAATSLRASMSKSSRAIPIDTVRADPMGVLLPTSQYELRELAVNLATACVPADKPWIPRFLKRMGGEFASLFFRYVQHKPWAVEAGGAGSEWQTALLSNLRS